MKGFANSTTTATTGNPDFSQTSPFSGGTDSQLDFSLSTDASSISYNSTLFQTDYVNVIDDEERLTADEFVDYMSMVSLWYVIIGIGVMLSSFIQVLYN